MITTGTAVLYTFALGGVIFFCRVLPFILFRDRPEKKEPRERAKDFRGRFLSVVEKTVPPVAMTVLAVNAMAVPIRDKPAEALPVLAAAGLTALLQLWKRNVLLSISAGTLLYMLLERFGPALLR
ncbi:MAG: AzlD domain-containing protein [Treponema sp.]|jgi:branched-subunit amino acid transport protein AzlD|nr:AzlD domain-containing protein [Treponema sp.]